MAQKKTNKPVKKVKLIKSVKTKTVKTVKKKQKEQISRSKKTTKQKSAKLARPKSSKVKKIKVSTRSTKSISKTKSSKYYGLAIVNKGIEDIAALEIKELIGAVGQKKEGAVLFPIKSFDDLCILSYKGQSFSRILLYLEEFTTSEQSTEKLFDNLKSDFTIAEKLVKKEDIKFAVRSTRIGEQEYQKQDLERDLGEKIHAIYNTVDLSNPNIIFHCYIIGEKYYIGIDFSGEIDKREYRIYTTPKELKATIAYSLLRIGGYDGKKAMLDPFAGSGTIAIEAALFSTNTSARYFKKGDLQFTKFDKLKFHFEKHEKKKEGKNISSSDASLHNLKCAEKNAKVASVNKAVSVSRIDIEWLDTKFDEHELDMIVSWPIESSKEQDVKEVYKLYKEFFYQIEYILKKKCKIILIIKKPESITALKDAAKEFFKPTHERQVAQGKETLNVLVFERK